MNIIAIFFKNIFLGLFGIGLIELARSILINRELFFNVDFFGFLIFNWSMYIVFKMVFEFTKNNRHQ